LYSSKALTELTAGKIPHRQFLWPSVLSHWPRQGETQTLELFDFTLFHFILFSNGLLGDAFELLRNYSARLFEA